MKRSSFRNRARQMGVSIIGVLLGLVLSGIALSIVLTQYQAADSAQNVQKNISNVVTIIGSAKANYGSLAYGNLNTTTAIGSGVIPTSLVVNSTTAANEWGGAVTLVDNSATTPATALLSWAAVPSDICQQLVNGTHPAARRIQVAGSDVKPLDGTLNIATLNTRCTSATAVAVTWTVGRT